jgi:hypothetical protein
MVCIKFSARPQNPIISPRFVPMALGDEHRESSAEQREASLTDEQVVFSAEASSEQGARSDGENPSGGSDDSKNASDRGGRLKIGAEAALAGVSYNFGQLTVMRAHVTTLKSFTPYFLKGFA